MTTTTELNKPRISILQIVVALVILAAFFGLFKYHPQKRELKQQIKTIEKERDSVTDLQLQREKNIEYLNEVISNSNKKQQDQKATIKYLRNETKKTKYIYINATLNERIDIFTRLANKRDSLRRQTKENRIPG